MNAMNAALPATKTMINCRTRKGRSKLRRRPCSPSRSACDRSIGNSRKVAGDRSGGRMWTVVVMRPVAWGRAPCEPRQNHHCVATVCGRERRPWGMAEFVLLNARRDHNHRGVRPAHGNCGRTAGRLRIDSAHQKAASGPLRTRRSTHFPGMRRLPGPPVNPPRPIPVLYRGPKTLEMPHEWAYPKVFRPNQLLPYHC
jgi:hypothetical protein